MPLPVICSDTQSRVSHRSVLVSHPAGNVATHCDTLAQLWFNAGPPSLMLVQYWISEGGGGKRQTDRVSTWQYCLMFGDNTSCVVVDSTLTLISPDESCVVLCWLYADFAISWRVKWNESGFRPPLCTYRLNWARRTSWGADVWCVLLDDSIHWLCY